MFEVNIAVAITEVFPTILKGLLVRILYEKYKNMICLSRN